MRRLLRLSAACLPLVLLCSCAEEPAQYIVGQHGTASRAVISYEEYSGIEDADGHLEFGDVYVVSNDDWAGEWHPVDTGSTTESVVRTD